jgi:hypothetical protein
MEAQQVFPLVLINPGIVAEASKFLVRNSEILWRVLYLGVSIVVFEVRKAALAF